MKWFNNRGMTKRFVSKEVLIGLLAIGLGTYNILSMVGVINKGLVISQVFADILLILTGFFLWITNFKLSRHKYHTKKMF